MSQRDAAAWAVIVLTSALVAGGLALALRVKQARGRGEDSVALGPLKVTSSAHGFGLVALGVGALIIAFTFGVFEEPAGTTPPSDRRAVPLVYNLTKDRALQLLDDAGFTHVRSGSVCSNSVAGGRVREVIFDNGADDVSDETSVVNQLGVVIPDLPADQKLLVKVANGQPC